MTLTKDEVQSIRTRLGMSQVQLAQLLGVHPLTVSRWERGMLAPAPHQQAMLESFRRATSAKTDIGSTVGALMLTAGIAVALYALLHAAFGENGSRA